MSIFSHSSKYKNKGHSRENPTLFSGFSQFYSSIIPVFPEKRKSKMSEIVGFMTAFEIDLSDVYKYYLIITIIQFFSK